MCDFADLSYFDLFIYDYKFKDNCRESSREIFHGLLEKQAIKCSCEASYNYTFYRSKL